MADAQAAGAYEEKSTKGRRKAAPARRTLAGLSLISRYLRTTLMTGMSLAQLHVVLHQMAAAQTPIPLSDLHKTV
eukprot:scaffold1315_cov405-Prasinococcus_capsulatus_cf.AAC.5